MLKRWCCALELTIDFDEFMNFSGEMSVGGTIKNEATKPRSLLYNLLITEKRNKPHGLAQSLNRFSISLVGLAYPAFFGEEPLKLDNEEPPP